MKKHLITALTLATAAVSATPFWDGCDDFEVGAQAIYFKPSHCAYEYASTDLEEPVVTVSDIKADYDWGFRVFAGYYQGCSYAHLSYLWYRERDAAHADLPNAFPFGPGQDRVRAHLDHDYQTADLRIGRHLFQQGGCEFSLFGNVRWVEIKRCDEVEAIPEQGDPAVWLQKADFKGAGLGVGTGGQFCVWNGFNIDGSFNLMGIIGERRTPFFETEDGDNVSQTLYRGTSSIVPALDFRVGFNYTFDAFCSLVILEAGYEMDYYWNALEYNLPASVLPAQQDRTCFDIGFAGLYFGCRVVF